MHTKTICVAAAMSASLLWLTACAAPTVRPDDMSAVKHRQEAERESRLARELVASRTHGIARTPAALEATEKDYRYSVPISLPWKATGCRGAPPPARPRPRARAHFLERFEAIECRDFPPSSRAACPLLGPLTSVDDIPGGVRARFSQGRRSTPSSRTCRCHYAYARARDFDVVASCPLYMRGIDIRRDDDPMAVDTSSPGTPARPRRSARAAARKPSSSVTNPREITPALNPSQLRLPSKDMLADGSSQANSGVSRSAPQARFATTDRIL